MDNVRVGFKIVYFVDFVVYKYDYFYRDSRSTSSLHFNSAAILLKMIMKCYIAVQFAVERFSGLIEQTKCI